MQNLFIWLSHCRPSTDYRLDSWIPWHTEGSRKHMIKKHTPFQWHQVKNIKAQPSFLLLLLLLPKCSSEYTNIITFWYFIFSETMIYKTDYETSEKQIDNCEFTVISKFVVQIKIEIFITQRRSACVWLIMHNNLLIILIQLK